MFCNQCGNKMPDNSSYCQYCGNKLDDNNNQNANLSNQNAMQGGTELSNTTSVNNIGSTNDAFRVGQVADNPFGTEYNSNSGNKNNPNNSGVFGSQYGGVAPTTRPIIRGNQLVGNNRFGFFVNLVCGVFFVLVAIMYFVDALGIQVGYFSFSKDDVFKVDLPEKEFTMFAIANGVATFMNVALAALCFTQCGMIMRYNRIMSGGFAVTNVSGVREFNGDGVKLGKYQRLIKILTIVIILAILIACGIDVFVSLTNNDMYKALQSQYTPDQLDKSAYVLLTNAAMVFGLAWPYGLGLVLTIIYLSMITSVKKR